MKLWGGRFTRETAQEVADFQNSLSFDCRLYRHDIRGSIAHAKMLGRQGIITGDEAQTLVRGLQEILHDLDSGLLEFDPACEDIHSFVETCLVQRVGEVGKKLHTARSRNDQVATDLRLFVKEGIEELGGLLLQLEEVLLQQAERSTRIIMPGYTHLQRAQPITFAHHLLAYCEMFRRDCSRLKDCYARADVCPLGSGALAGTTFPIDRYFVAGELGFREISANSLDAVSDRDYVAELIFDCSLIMTHISRLAEELVLWSSSEFSLVTIDDAYTTGSSIMPQKKNPDVAELARGKTGRIYGHLMGILTVLKGLPLAYNKDLQEDKEHLFDTLDSVRACLRAFIPMLATLKPNQERMREAAGADFTNATDLADYLVRQGVSFREAHHIAGQIILRCLEKKCKLEELSLEEYREFCPVCESDLYDFISIETCVERRRAPGGPAPLVVEQHIERLRQWLQKMREQSWGDLGGIEE